eukprot:gene11218-23445_t
MTHRGRGCQEIRPSNDPFFQTTNSLVGCNLEEKVEWAAPSVNRGTQKISSAKKGDDGEPPDFSFLYKRTSDTIGEKVPKSKFQLSNEPSKAEIARRRGQGLYPADHAEVEEETNVEGEVDMASVLEHYVHNPKTEDPRYTTSSNEYGKRKPTAATFVLERNSRPQGFSASFNNVKPKNSSLNTSITKSTVHPKLDPQFI